jgi:hypothetical protein
MVLATSRLEHSTFASAIPPNSLTIQSLKKVTSSHHKTRSLSPPFTFSDAAGKPSATVLEHMGRGVSKAPRLDKDGHLITGYYDLHKTAPHSALPVIIAVIKTPAFYLLSFAQHAACF